MKVGDLVRPVRPTSRSSQYLKAPIVEEGWLGIIIDFGDDDNGVSSKYPVVYWNPKFHAEVEYPDQIRVVGGSYDV